MIVRIWTGEALEDDAEDYRKHFSEVYMKRLRAIAGFRGVEVLERVHHDRIEFVVMTRWDTMDAIHELAGHKHPDHAVIEEEAREALERYDEKVKHYVLVQEESR